MCATIRICKTCKYIKMFERIRFYPNRNIFDFRDEIFEKKKKKNKRNDFAYSISVSCVVRLIHIRIVVNRRTCTPKSFCEWIKRVNFLHKGYYDIMYYD